MGKYEDMMAENASLAEAEAAAYSLAERGMREMADDARRIAELYAAPEAELASIDERFSQATRLDGLDAKFIMLATALQIGRWIAIGEVNGFLNGKIDSSRVEHDDKSVTDREQKRREKYKKRHEKDPHVKSEHRDWANIAFDGVPYDISRGCGDFDVSMGGGLHRIHTLGHDPVLGWLFGTMNILSDTITLDKAYLFRTFDVEMVAKPRMWKGETNAGAGFLEAYDSVKEDMTRLGAAVFAQALHLESDAYTKLGLPVPVLETFAPEHAMKIYKDGYDALMLAKDAAVVGVQTIASILVNMLVAAVHGLYYDPAKHGSHELFEVRTRKVLSVSNAIASCSNVVAVAAMEAAAAAGAASGNPEAARWGKKGWEYLDIGGIAVTMYRLVTDTRFIASVKAEYLESEWGRTVLGEEYRFASEVEAMSNKDIAKGIEIQAKADAAAQRKVADGLEKHAELLEGMKEGQGELRRSMEVVLGDMAAMEARGLYGLERTRQPSDLGGPERRALCAAVYTLLKAEDNPTEEQREYLLNLERHLGVSDRSGDFDFSRLSNIDSNSDRRLALDVLCGFLYLENCDTAFAEDGLYPWLGELGSKRDIEEACAAVEEEFSAVGAAGIALRYAYVALQVPAEEAAAPTEGDGAAADDAAEAADDGFERLCEIVSARTSDEESFGAPLAIDPSKAPLKDVLRAFPQLEPETIVSATRVGNGCLVFTTCAMYVRAGGAARGPYARVPYAEVDLDGFSMALGRRKGTRKLSMQAGADGAGGTIEIDDSIIEEERLRDLLVEIRESGCSVAETDLSLRIWEIGPDALAGCLESIGGLLAREGHGLAELFLVAGEYGLGDRWADIAGSIPEGPCLEAAIASFSEALPYPSKNQVSKQALSLALRTLCRSNAIEGREATTLSAEAERLARLFPAAPVGNAEFTQMLEDAAGEARPSSPADLAAALESVGEATPHAADIKKGLEAMLAKAESEAERASKGPLDDLASGIAATMERARDLGDELGRAISGLIPHVRQAPEGAGRPPAEESADDGIAYPDGFIEACDAVYAEIGPISKAYETLGCWVFETTTPLYISGPMGVVISTGEVVHFHIPSLMNPKTRNAAIIERQVGERADVILDTLLSEERGYPVYPTPERYWGEHSETAGDKQRR